MAINKVDLPEVQVRMPEISRLFNSLGLEVFFISAMTGQGLAELVSEVTVMLESMGDIRMGPEVPITVFRPKPKVGRRRERAD